MPISLSGSLLITGSLTTSGTLTAQTLVVQTVTSSVVYSSGSNIFGNQLTNVQQMTGSLRVTGSGNHYIQGGNVGIGTSSPSAKFMVLSDTNTSATNIGRFAAANNTLAIGIGYETIRQTETGGSILFETNATERMRITSGGNVGIGTNSPNIIGFTGTMLTVNGTGNYQGLEIATSGTSRMTMTVDSSNTYGIISTRQTGMYLIFEVGAASEAMRINPSKQIGINSANTSARLNMTFGGAGQNGFSMLDGDNTVNATFIDFKNSSGTIIGSVSRAGGTNAVTYNTTSDYRLKEDLKDFNGLDKVSAIKVYDFRWKGTNERTDGVIAHELSEVLPYAVHGEKDRLDGDNNPLYQGVDYSKIVPVLVKAIQELKAENDTLKEILQRNNIQ